MDPDLHAQFPMIKQLLTTLNIPILESEGWEGDDILGTLARAGEEAGCDMYLVTGDRDMYQLVTEHINVVSTRKGLSDVAIMTPESVDDLDHGITPALVPDFYGLKGDSSDNIPGVPGIGPKKASALIAQYGSLDEVIAHADEVKGKMGENLRAHIDDALLSRKVATIRTDAPVAYDFENEAFPAFDAQAVNDALGELGIMAMQNRFLALIDGGEVPASAAFEMSKPAMVTGSDRGALADAADELSRALEAGEWVAAVLDDDREEGALFGMTHTLWVATGRCLFSFEQQLGGAVEDIPGFDFSRGLVAGVLSRLLREGRVVSPDIKGLIHELSPVDSSEAEQLDPLTLDSARLFDTVVAAYLLDSSRDAFDDAYLADRYLQVSLAPARGEEGAANDAPARAGAPPRLPWRFASRSRMPLSARARRVFFPKLRCLLCRCLLPWNARVCLSTPNACMRYRRASKARSMNWRARSAHLRVTIRSTSRALCSSAISCST